MERISLVPAICWRVVSCFRLPHVLMTIHSLLVLEMIKFVPEDIDGFRQSLAPRVSNQQRIKNQPRDESYHRLVVHIGPVFSCMRHDRLIWGQQIADQRIRMYELVTSVYPIPHDLVDHRGSCELFQEISRATKEN